jgi:hypothetical protein
MKGSFVVMLVVVDINIVLFGALEAAGRSGMLARTFE